jgi:hypothetical protein
MRPSLKNIPKRTADKARDAAAGSAVPAGQEQPPPDAPPAPVTAERGTMRKRVRRLSRLREVQMRELGALVVELRRLGRENPDLVSLKAAQALAVDEELRRLRTALGERQTVEQVVSAGVSGSCARCGTLMATDDRFCPHCGRAVAPVKRAAEAGVPAAPEEDAGPDEQPVPEPRPASAEPAPVEPAPKAAAPPPPPPPPPPPVDREASARAATEPAPAVPPPPARTPDELTATAPPQP